MTRYDPLELRVPTTYAARSTGFDRVGHVDRSVGAVHTSLATCQLAPAGQIESHVHSFEEFVFVLEGQLTLTLDGSSHRLAPNDCAFVAVGATHGWRNPSDQAARWIEMQTPIPRAEPTDTYFVDDEATRGDPQPVNVLDPRTRSFYRWHPAQMDVDVVRRRQDADAPQMSSNYAGALHAYSGIAVKMLLDERHGAHLGNVFMVDYEPATILHPHDHPLEEAFYMLEGEVAYVADDEEYLLTAGDVALAAVGCVHSFENRSGRPARWLETRSPLPPVHHSYRFDRDWSLLAQGASSS